RFWIFADQFAQFRAGMVSIILVVPRGSCVKMNDGVPWLLGIVSFLCGFCAGRIVLVHKFGVSQQSQDLKIERRNGRGFLGYDLRSGIMVKSGFGVSQVQKGERKVRIENRGFSELLPGFVVAIQSKIGGSQGIVRSHVVGISG